MIWIARHAIAMHVALAVVLMGVLVAGSVAFGGDDTVPVAGAASEEGAHVAEPITLPGALKMFAAALAIGVTALATGYAMSRIGSAGVGAMAENPKLFGSLLIFLVIPETMVILGFVIAALMIF